MNSNIYLPQTVKVLKNEKISPTVNLIRVAPIETKRFPKNEQGLVFNPGQFAMVGQIGWGEGPFGPLSSPYEDKYMEFAIRAAGVATNYLHTVPEKETVTLRGPFGNGFPMDFLEGKDVVAVTGGCGIPPISATMEYIAANRKKFGNVYVLYGAKVPEELLLQDRMAKWAKSNIKVITTIDKPALGWGGHVGFVPDLIKEISIDAKNTAVIMCGPGPMVAANEKVLRPLGISDRRIFVNMERKMQCGVGKCQHCTCGKKYVCKDGPVFNLDEVDKAWD